MATNQKKYFLLKRSDGKRGQNGKQKIYVVTVNGVHVITEWGMAEKSLRRSQPFVFVSPWAAQQEAQRKVYAKLDRGYTLTAQV